MVKIKITSQNNPQINRLHESLADLLSSLFDKYSAASMEPERLLPFSQMRAIGMYSESD
jgi:hypothetical protein